ncbi:MAG: transposase [Solirubrobacteraceae bacterium MAG38_C4-C5]|nr:transposase [Candidatus Siliceabacter maunaloa]
MELIPALDRAIETAARVGGLEAVKQRARGCSPGQLLVTVAESMLCGGDSMLDLERLRGDQAGAELRAVGEVPAASTACQLAQRYRPTHLRAAEAAFARCANAMDAQIGRAPDGPVTLDFDSTGVEVYGRQKKGTGVNYQGQLAYQPLLCSWAQRGRLLASEFIALLCCCLIERQLRNAMNREQITQLPLYPEDRACTAPTAVRIFDHLAPLQRHHLIRDGQAVQTFEPQLTPLQAQLLDLLGVPVSAYTSNP